SLIGPDFHRLDRTSFAWRTHSITSSASCCNPSVSFNPSAPAVFPLITSSNLVVCVIDRSAGFAPLSAQADWVGTPKASTRSGARRKEKSRGLVGGTEDDDRSSFLQRVMTN